MDAFERLANCTPNSIEAVVSDMPFGVREFDSDHLAKKRSGCGGAAGAIVVGDVASPDTTGRMWGQTMPIMGEADFGNMAELHAPHHGTAR